MSSPDLINIQFDLESAARLKYKRYLVIDLGKDGYVELESVCATTPWCPNCRQHFHSEDDPDCPKKKGISYADNDKGKGKQPDPRPGANVDGSRKKDGQGDKYSPSKERNSSAVPLKTPVGEKQTKRDDKEDEKVERSSEEKGGRTDRPSDSEGHRMDVDEKGGEEDEEKSRAMEEDTMKIREKRKREEEETNSKGTSDVEDEVEEEEEERVEGKGEREEDEDFSSGDSPSLSDENEEEEEGAKIGLMARAGGSDPSMVYDNAAYDEETPLKVPDEFSKPQNDAFSSEDCFSDC
ncbi:hypothetical protein CBR_g36729 [Chara braunii]|uniref:Uncharacterized protein n=1 Tax=Chara braunii TaxID=69332 RepID=A0A388LLH8_CHABU|nr:hypothetical protein CBR_g36729 [Chara braunii]|eukprot:GBG83111.1 hypothetical protein CBR_g36729 [Chara braunii]